MFIFNDKFKKLIALQITTAIQDMGPYTTLSENEYSVISRYLYPYPKNILDLGCGLGRMSIFLNKKRPSDSKYYLADSSEVPESAAAYGWNPGDSWYNDLNLTKEFCELNGLNNFEIIDLKSGGLHKLENIDLVFSFLAVGFHYPIESYLAVLKQIMAKDGLMIFGVRRGVYENSTILSKFDFVSFNDIPNSEKERVLILKGWKL